MSAANGANEDGSGRSEVTMPSGDSSIDMNEETEEAPQMNVPTTSMRETIMAAGDSSSAIEEDSEIVVIRSEPHGFSYFTGEVLHRGVSDDNLEHCSPREIGPRGIPDGGVTRRTENSVSVLDLIMKESPKTDRPARRRHEDNLNAAGPSGSKRKRDQKRKQDEMSSTEDSISAGPSGVKRNRKIKTERDEMTSTEDSISAGPSGVKSHRTVKTERDEMSSTASAGPSGVKRNSTIKTEQDEMSSTEDSISAGPSGVKRHRTIKTERDELSSTEGSLSAGPSGVKSHRTINTVATSGSFLHTVQAGPSGINLQQNVEEGAAHETFEDTTDAAPSGINRFQGTIERIFTWTRELGNVLRSSIDRIRAFLYGSISDGSIEEFRTRGLWRPHREADNSTMEQERGNFYCNERTATVDGDNVTNEDDATDSDDGYRVRRIKIIIIVKSHIDVPSLVAVNVRVQNNRSIDFGYCPLFPPTPHVSTTRTTYTDGDYIIFYVELYPPTQTPF